MVALPIIENDGTSTAPKLEDEIIAPAGGGCGAISTICNTIVVLYSSHSHLFPSCSMLNRAQTIDSAFLHHYGCHAPQHSPVYRSNPQRHQDLHRPRGARSALHDHATNIQKNEQKTPEFLLSTPTAAIPALTDTFGDGQTIRIFESGSIMQYLVEQYDQKDHKISYPQGTREYYEVNNWCFL